jgi:glycosyltransferase involved in cell wall biosynthesis
MTPATIVICTYNRAALLGRAVASALAEAHGVTAEVLVVDNASTDETPALLARLARRSAGLRLAHEPRLGLSAARNRGLAEARGAVTVYLDDDAVPHPGWLDALLRPYDAPAVAAVGGRIRLHFPSPPPAWLTPALHHAFSAYDRGQEPRVLRYGHDEYPYGANISFRTAAARAAGGFSTRLGPRGRTELLHDETDLCFRLERAGGEIRYAPAAVVDHWVMPERVTVDGILRRHELAGRSAAVFVLRNRGLARALWRIRWLYARQLFARPYAAREPIDAERLLAECRRREALGYVRGLVRALPASAALRREARAPVPLAAAGLRV